MSITHAVVGEVNADGDRLLVARGGDGGGPDNRFLAKSGVAHSISLDLKLIADVGLVGYVLDSCFPDMFILLVINLFCDFISIVSTCASDSI